MAFFLVCVWFGFFFLLFFLGKLQVLLRFIANNWVWQPVASTRSLLGVGESLEASWWWLTAPGTLISKVRYKNRGHRQPMRPQRAPHSIFLQVYSSCHCTWHGIEMQVYWMEKTKSGTLSILTYGWQPRRTFTFPDSVRSSWRPAKDKVLRFPCQELLCCMAKITGTCFVLSDFPLQRRGNNISPACCCARMWAWPSLRKKLSKTEYQDHNQGLFVGLQICWAGSQGALPPVSWGIAVYIYVYYILLLSGS